MLYTVYMCYIQYIICVIYSTQYLLYIVQYVLSSLCYTQCVLCVIYSAQYVLYIVYNICYIQRVVCVIYSV